MRDLFLGNDKNSHLKAYQRMVDIFHQEAFSNIKRNESKLRTYGLLKSEPGFERYLTDIKSVKKRKSLTKLRLSNHLLMIEKGRHKQIDRNQRYCPFCPDSIEDEMHFLLKCEAYKFSRPEFLESAQKLIPSFNSQNVTQKFISLVNSTPMITSQFVYKASEMREFLLRKHKVLG